MDVVERQVAPHVANVGAQRGEQLPDHLLSLPAVRTLEVPIFDECHRRLLGPANVITVGVGFVDQIEDVLGGGRRSAAHASSRGSRLTVRGDGPGEQRREDHGAERTQPRLIKPLAGERKAGDQQGTR